MPSQTVTLVTKTCSHCAGKYGAQIASLSKKQLQVGTRAGVGTTALSRSAGVGTAAGCGAKVGVVGRAISVRSRCLQYAFPPG